MREIDVREIVRELRELTGLELTLKQSGRSVRRSTYYELMIEDDVPWALHPRSPLLSAHGAGNMVNVLRAYRTGWHQSMNAAAERNR